MTMLLERCDCDVNALDAFGNTAVSYALAAGRLHNACFLIQNLNCRLEAEYEGQASFYYVLHIAPSFASRAIIRELLMAKRDRAFLHCDADNKTCGCKTFERNGDENRALCGFCGHEASSHRMMPLPSWFRDQYDTYLAPNSAQERPRSSSGEDSNSDTETSHNLSEFNAAGDEDEETVHENERGRLDVEMLKRITVVRYDDLLHANGLAVDAQVADETITARSDRENCRPTWNNSTEIEYIAEMSCTNTPEEPSQSTAEGILQRDADKCVDLNGTSSRRRDATSSGGKLTDYPWWLRQELAMVHSPRCLCQKSAFVTNPTQLVLVAVCRWLRHTAIVHKHAALVRDLGSSCSSAGVTETAIVALASVQPAFEHWRDVARLEVREPAKAVARPSTRVLRSVLFQWQHGKEFLAFQRWKNHRTSAEVTHHRLATRLEEVVADMRRHRFATLNLRQQKLQDSTRNLLSFK
ncbi:hypothetical protein PF002_g20878 [Phytophthora fragariae]|uniref:Uncharacterized protein n=2 Tax=Phytophthora fragariae TaxID=53985 RepID=A0A6A3XJ91_9STRA|nr:hypothetical protein PF003_g10431 [Phytophthora fragariae]KAE8936810.1 hypothetical protein PF009_g13265 [Phytophthora fragariae]KAE9007797.1 hypothetical protein PF011_g10967 [Phytophthora fragariae]KAE9109221.1 hypothetical protein PF007_g12325 [Phytophthora fragariae]KAE9143660.1 hypothetical protein PF006_g11330 [Phytophthora fragariae]